MICYLVRHGKDDETVRGGWSTQPLTEEGIQQSQQLAERMSSLPIENIYSSDLCRAMDTAKILANKLQLTVIPLSQFREVNNGDLAGMKNDMHWSIILDSFGTSWNGKKNIPEEKVQKTFTKELPQHGILFLKKFCHKIKMLCW